MSSPDREKEKAALAELDKFCKRQNEIAEDQSKRQNEIAEDQSKRQNEIAEDQSKRHAKIEWIKREIEKFDDSRLNRIVILIKQIKEQK